MLGFNGDSVTYLPDKGDTLVRLICYDVPGDVMVDSFDDADFRESFAVGARGNFYSFDFTVFVSVMTVSLMSLPMCLRAMWWFLTPVICPVL